jgi:6-pyruvoyltetrahydropterin/6-carboxytetrahydropterin synthase
MEVVKTFVFDAAHRLYCHEGLCKNLHGHTYKLEVCLEAILLNPSGMIIDFGKVKTLLGPIVMEFDHAIILQNIDPLYKAIIELVDRIVIFDEPPTAEIMAHYFLERFSYELIGFSPFVQVKFVRVWETATSYAQCNKGE